jgi:hypothetical protein
MLHKALTQHLTVTKSLSLKTFLPQPLGKCQSPCRLALTSGAPILLVSTRLIVCYGMVCFPTRWDTNFGLAVSPDIYIYIGTRYTARSRISQLVSSSSVSSFTKQLPVVITTVSASGAFRFVEMLNQSGKSVSMCGCCCSKVRQYNTFIFLSPIAYC